MIYRIATLKATGKPSDYMQPGDDVSTPYQWETWDGGYDSREAAQETIDELVTLAGHKPEHFRIIESED